MLLIKIGSCKKIQIWQIKFTYLLISFFVKLKLKVGERDFSHLRQDVVEYTDYMWIIDS